jgi:hypothetical protein
MATKKFRAPAGIETQVADFISPDETKKISAIMSDNGELSFTGTAGQLFTVADSGSGSIFSANDISGIPSIEILDTGLVKIAETSGNVLLGTSTDNGNKLQVNGNANIGGLILEGSVDSGATTYAGYRPAGTNLILKGNSTGVSGIFFQSEKDGTNINHPTDYGYIQFHAQGIDGVSGENNKMVIGVANDSPDSLVLQSPYKNGVKISFKDVSSGTGGTEYTVWHAGNHGATSGLDADLLDGQQGSWYQQALVSGTNIKTINGVSVLGSGDVTINAAGGGITYTKKIANYTAVDKDGILADTSSGSFTVTLPSSPTVGMQVWIADGSSWALNNLTVAPSVGTSIGDLAVNESLVLDIAGIEIHLIYTGTKWLYYYSSFGSNGSGITFEKQAQFSLSGITTVTPIFTVPVTTYRGGNIRLTVSNGAAYRYMIFNILQDGTTVQMYDVSGG